VCFGVRVSFLKLLGNEIVDLDPFSPLPTGKNWARILRIVLPRTWISALFSLSLSLLSLFRLSFCVDLGFGLPDCLKRTSSLMTVPSLKGCGDRIWFNDYPCLAKLRRWWWGVGAVCGCSRKVLCSGVVRFSSAIGYLHHENRKTETAWGGNMTHLQVLFHGSLHGSSFHGIFFKCASFEFFILIGITFLDHMCHFSCYKCIISWWHVITKCVTHKSKERITPFAQV
jgi:hypothetical protein